MGLVVRDDGVGWHKVVGAVLAVTAVVLPIPGEAQVEASSPAGTGSTGVAEAKVPSVEDARLCWDMLAEVHQEPGVDRAVSRAVVDRLLATPAGRALVTDLCAVLADPETSALEVRLTTSFVRRLPGRVDGLDGAFRPDRAGADHYELAVRVYPMTTAAGPDAVLYGEYPGNPDCSIVFFYQEPVSSMAQTLYHELLHVWFLHAFQRPPRRYPTGHGRPEACEFEEEFLEHLRAHSADLAALEGRTPPRLLPGEFVGRALPY